MSDLESTRMLVMMLRRYANLALLVTAFEALLVLTFWMVDETNGVAWTIVVVSFIVGLAASVLLLSMELALMRRVRRMK